MAVIRVPRVITKKLQLTYKNVTRRNYVSSLYPDSVYLAGCLGTLWNDEDDGSYEFRGFIRFPDTIAAPVRWFPTMVLGADSLRWYDPGIPGQDESYFSYYVTGAIYVVKNDWDPDALTWNNQPGIGSQFAQFVLSAGNIRRDRGARLSTRLDIEFDPSLYLDPDDEDDKIFGFAVRVASAPLGLNCVVGISISGANSFLEEV